MTADWRADELRKNKDSGVVGQRLASETDAVRVWIIDLAPGERLPYHTHVLNYFWTATSAGTTRSHYSDGKVTESATKAGDTHHYKFGLGESMTHDLENIGTGRASYVTVELKIGSPNAPLPLPAMQ